MTEPVKLSVLGAFLKGGSLAKSDLDTNGEYPCILYGELYTKYSSVAHQVYSLTNSLSKSVKGSYGDILFPTSGETSEAIARATAVLQEGVLYGGDLTIFRIHNQNEIKPIFLSYLLNSPKMRKAISFYAQGNTVSHLSSSNLQNILVAIPSLPEQQKIANFFSTLDKNIDAHIKKLGLLKQQKQGYMQQVFNRTLRFRDDNGAEYGEWEYRSMDSISTISMGFTPSTKNPSLWKGKLPWLSIRELGQGKYITQTSKGITKEAAQSKKLIPKNSLIMSFKLTLGRLAITRIPLYTNEAICFFDWISPEANTEYLYYALSQVDVASFGSRAVMGITLNTESLKSIVVPYPSLPEQEKIAEFFVALDENIDAVARKIELLKEQKQGYMQRMFLCM